jgi:hypothetical protein
MANASTTQARLDAAAAEDARRLIEEMQGEGTEVSRDKLVRALLWGVTAPQAVGMLRAYIAHAHRDGEKVDR